MALAALARAFARKPSPFARRSCAISRRTSTTFAFAPEDPPRAEGLRPSAAQLGEATSGLAGRRAPGHGGVGGRTAGGIRPSGPQGEEQQAAGSRQPSGAQQENRAGTEHRSPFPSSHIPAAGKGFRCSRGGPGPSEREGERHQASRAPEKFLGGEELDPDPPRKLPVAVRLVVAPPGEVPDVERLRQVWLEAAVAV
eukprot:CAMPEP_0177604748 /NCGR_PEP_ID=MMETSP0419_2-20121207/16295_1 /TAXON_ID=582737 /ORGANISM="Tetraselmis sp., Strain GSL018" /LENGTH=196 /DNA_ID=CAMNT_0019098775 /DNA_START=235 /DNA_END=825 /DNA_ORIENTATION=-